MNKSKAKIELLSETAQGRLIGGFSFVLEITANNATVVNNCQTNNCKAMNCVGCGTPGPLG